MHETPVMEMPFAYVEIEVVLSIMFLAGMGGLRCHASRFMPVPSPRCSRQQKRRDCEEIAR
jgi:hypothetical protein